MTSEDAINLGTNPYMKSGQGNPVGGKRVLRADEKVRDTLTPTVRCPAIIAS